MKKKRNIRKGRYIFLSVVAAALFLASCGGIKNGEKEQSADKAIREEDIWDGATAGKEISSDEVQISVNGTGKTGYRRYTAEELEEMVKNSGNDTNGDGRLTAADFDLIDDDGMEKRSLPVFSEDFEYNPYDTESDDYMENYIGISGITGSGRYVMAYRLDVMDGQREIRLSNGSTARMAGKPYIIGVSGTEDFKNEYAEFYDTPLRVSLSYDYPMLGESGIDGEKEEKIKAYLKNRWSDTYETLEGSLDTEEKKYSFTATLPGEYVLGVTEDGEGKTVEDQTEEENHGKIELKRIEVTEEYRNGTEGGDNNE